MTDLVKVFHIAPVNDSEVELFELRVPNTIMRGEDNTVGRICVGRTIHDCIKAHPHSFYNLTNKVDENPDATFSDYEDWMASFTVQLESKKRFLLYKVYTLEVSESDLIGPAELQEKGLVPDALFTQEHWLMKETPPVSIQYLIIDSKYEAFDSDEFFVDYLFNYEVTEDIPSGTLLREDVLFYKAREFNIDLDKEFSQKEIELLKVKPSDFRTEGSLNSSSASF